MWYLWGGEGGLERALFAQQSGRNREEMGKKGQGELDRTGHRNTEQGLHR